MKKFLVASAVALFLAPVFSTAQAQSGVRTWTAPNGDKYIFVPGQFTQQQAWAQAVARGGKPVVFSSMAEHKMVMDAFGYKSIAPCHTGHYQLPTGREPGIGWVTYTGEKSAPLSQLFNSNGPDDGIKNKWGWNISDGGIEIWYGPSAGKNEDAGVIWHDNGGKLEDVSVNHKGGVMVEIKKKK